jgi:hypothetical protein
MYRQIWERVSETDEENVKQFEKFVSECMEGSQTDDLDSAVLNDKLVVEDSCPLAGKRFVLVG